jgi:MFS family permease
MNSSRSPWYASVTRYQWLVLIVASLGWVFDAFEGQIYNLTRADMLPDLLQVKADDPQVKLWGERFLGIFLLGGTFGGLLFSSLADRWGRNPVMALTILFYSIFSGSRPLRPRFGRSASYAFSLRWALGESGR